MSLFDAFSPQKRKFQAALTIVLAKYTYSSLSEEDQKKIDDEVIKVVATIEPAGPTLAYYAMPEEHRYGLIAAALKQTGIPPAIPGEKWSLTGSSFSVDIDDPAFDKAVEEAIAYLQNKGVKLYPDEE